MSQDLRRTALTTWHEQAGAKMADFAGWSMPLEYPTGVLAEHRAVREECGVFDVSHMGVVHLRGATAISAANGLLTNDLMALNVEQVQYTMMCNDDGGVIDDLLASRLAEDEVLLVPNAANTARVVGELSKAVPSEGLSDESEPASIIAVQGPESRRILEGLGLNVSLDYMSARRVTFGGDDIVVSRTGYTGELGFELIVPASRAGEVWAGLVEAGATPCGLGCRDTLRTEMGYALHGQDLSEQITPVEAGLSWAVAWDKSSFVGSSVLRDQRESGPTRRLRGINLIDRGVLRPGMRVEVGEREVGEREVGILTSGTFSPTLKKGIGLALLDADVSNESPIQVAVRGRRLAAAACRPPFVDRSPK